MCVGVGVSVWCVSVGVGVWVLVGGCVGVSVLWIYMVLEILKLNEQLDSFSDFSEGQLNANGL